MFDFGESDGTFASASFEDVEETVRVDILNPTELFTASNAISGDVAGVQGVNASGGFAGSFDGAAVAAYVPGSSGAVFLPGPGDFGGIGQDINDSQNVVVGVSTDIVFDLRPALWKVDEDLAVSTSFFLGTGQGEAYFVGDTSFDPAFTVLYEEDGQDRFYLGSTQETGTFGAGFSILTAVQTGFIVENQSTNECFITPPNDLPQSVFVFGSGCVDATQTDSGLHILFGDGTVDEYASITITAPDNAMFVSAALPSKSFRSGWKHGHCVSHGDQRERNRGGELPLDLSNERPRCGLLFPTN